MHHSKHQNSGLSRALLAQVLLVYAEAVLIAQYSYQLLGRCLCDASDDAIPGTLRGSMNTNSSHWGTSSSNGMLFADSASPGGCVSVYGSDKALRILTTVLGLHSSVLRTAPLFCVYLLTLFHTYRLRRLDPTLGPHNVSTIGGSTVFASSELVGSGLSAGKAVLNHLLRVYW